jgi:hypothetical protein
MVLSVNEEVYMKKGYINIGLLNFVKYVDLVFFLLYCTVISKIQNYKKAI